MHYKLSNLWAIECASGYGVNFVGGFYKCTANYQTCGSSGCAQCLGGYGINSVGNYYKCLASDVETMKQ